ncbi:hemocyte protein-glutamine gamma-glutamyltransferase-like [Athalia rosae]|uniref:hemocyte protein-glutamine gamma-glutamyltransferase-like n=1 Tax=Athalia rosae TaxID=37344 RepID=UPI00203492B4|nr:hemocyte protein-glutamine gamma-glutamyltransferase-like [Athalia rosae]
MGNPLTVESVNIFEKENANLHHTSKYELVHQSPSSAVLRRGQPFKLAVKFNRSYTREVDSVSFIFNFGSNPNVMRGTRGVGVLDTRSTSSTDIEAWGVRFVSANAEGIFVEVTSPADSPVGLWHLDIQTTTKSGYRKITNTYHFDKDIYSLFNPWLKEDSVYMENQRLLDEYVNNDTGKIWVGALGSCKGREWIFGQFDDCVLPACQLLLERSGIIAASRGDPIKMSRAISRIVNANDDRGVLAGRWDGEYSDGTSPSAWTGSVPILEEFLKTGDSVQWGQCWVFAGVLTTVCRALGLPSRVVSNIVSAHDTNVSLSIDRYYNSKFESLNDPNSRGEDSIWNFHVWNEVWMARRDLPHGYGGWQAVDATPQETSDGMFQCGPTSVEAIKQGAVGYNYDVPFMLATVNADVIQWIEDKKSAHGWRRVTSDTNQVGKLILTKAPFMFDPNGDRDREVITQNYKNLEGTEAERLTLLRAARSTDSARRFYSIPDQAKEDVEFELVDLDRVNVGEPFTITLYVKNKSKSPRNIRVLLTASSVYYTGIKANLVKSKAGAFVVGPGDREVLKLTVTVDDYTDKLVEYAIMKLEAIATVKETLQTWSGEDDFQILKPTIDIKIEDKLIVGKSTAISFSFKNPLTRNLTKCEFNYAGIGLARHIKLPFENIRPGELVTVRHRLVPQKAGQLNLVATFTSKELVDVTGSATVRVLDKED